MGRAGAALSSVSDALFSKVRQRVLGLSFGQPERSFSISDPSELLRRSLEPYADRIKTAFVFGSVAKGTDTVESDIDLMVIGDGLDFFGLHDALRSAEGILNRKISPLFLSPEDWKRRVSRKGSFAAKVSARPKIFVLGSQEDLRT